MDHPKPVCFVVMGFKTKIDPETGRVLDLDKTYRYIIKPAAEAAGFTCIRADEVQHAGVIDVPMYEWLYKADLVIADLSTMNPNAFFELGVRYALKKRATIVVAEEQFKNPFDTNHISTRKYRHDGSALDIEVVETFRPQLIDAIRAIAAQEKIDSPVYTFLHGLMPPTFQDIERAAEAKSATAAESRVAEAGTEEARRALEAPMAALLDHALECRESGRFAEMAAILQGIRVAQGPHVDDFVIQQLALATYKTQQPALTDALLKAREILLQLNPRRTLDAETIGLWGAIHKRLADAPERTDEQRIDDLTEAIGALERGFHLLRDYYNGINAAYLYDLRARRSDGADALADRVIAGRIRTEVLEITEELIAGPPVGETEKKRQERDYWIRATRAEALLGLGRKDEAEAAKKEAAGLDGVEGWMIKSTEDQLNGLQRILGSS